MPKLPQAELDRALRDLPGWSVKDGAITKTFKHDSFAEAIVFVNAVAHLAELANHHPDIDIRYTNVTVSLVTHDQGGITDKDVNLAREIEEVRRKAGVAA
ncbi:MAG TPA: 4a-hydroxytetrahydrobiopterin dehydratase [Candidatus Eisenbacteria bacterium]|nr:4a-hydroxytetrahydrobiopterin dehydratase [Candidatus Eisenbacteria bacterium]